MSVISLTFTQILDVFSLIANIAIVFSLLFAGYQTMLNKKSYDLSNDRAEKEKAIELAELYAKEVIPRLSYIYAIYDQIGISQIISKLKSDKLTQFDKDELSDLLSSADLESIEKALENIDYSILLKNKITLSKKEHFSISFYYKVQNKLQLQKSTDIFTVDFKAVQEALENTTIDVEKFYSNLKMLQFDYLNARKEFIAQKNELLNILEYFCMYFNTGVAAENVVYQSLHQSFLDVVKICYFDIAKFNETGKDKYYTNIIDLYNLWNTRYLNVCSNEKELLRNNTVKAI